MLEVDKGLKVCFYDTVLSLDLTICLRVECGWKSPLDAKEVKEQWTEFWGKKRVFIGHDWVW